MMHPYVPAPQGYIVLWCPPIQGQAGLAKSLWGWGSLLGESNEIEGYKLTCIWSHVQTFWHAELANAWENRKTGSAFITVGWLRPLKKERRTTCCTNQVSQNDAVISILCFLLFVFMNEMPWNQSSQCFTKELQVFYSWNKHVNINESMS